MKTDRQSESTFPPQKRRWLHDAASVRPFVEELRRLIMRQVRSVVRGGVPACGCCDFKPQSHLNLYRCFHCGLWLCPRCAEAHFGKRRVLDEEVCGSQERRVDSAG